MAWTFYFFATRELFLILLLRRPPFSIGPPNLLPERSSDLLPSSPVFLSLPNPPATTVRYRVSFPLSCRFLIFFSKRFSLGWPESIYWAASSFFSPTGPPPPLSTILPIRSTGSDSALILAL